MRLFRIILLFLLFSCNSASKRSEPKEVLNKVTNQLPISGSDTLPNGQRLLDNKDSAMNYYYKEVVGSDTLKGGYIICYGVDDSMKYFYLRHGDTLHLLNQTKGSAHHLGILEKDFDTFFITSIDNGNGVAESYQIFDKKTGTNLLGNENEAWDYKFFNDTLYFLRDKFVATIIENSYIDRKEADSIFLYNLETGGRQGFKLPAKDPIESNYYSIKKITRNFLTIVITEHYSGKETVVRYSR